MTQLLSRSKLSSEVSLVTDDVAGLAGSLGSDTVPGQATAEWAACQ